MKHTPLQQIRDQLAHFAAAFLLIACFAFLQPLVAATLAGLYLGLVREVSQHNTFNILSFKSGALLDIAFWTLGGFVGGLILMPT